MRFSGGYTCNCCGKYFNKLPTRYASRAPIYYYEAEQDELEKRFKLDDDLCVMDKEHFFMRGNIEIPIIGTDEHFIWEVWVSLSEDNFHSVEENWDQQEMLKPMFGWLSTDLPCYPDTVNLKTNLHPRAGGILPFIELEPTDHPLAVESKKGVTIERVQEIAEKLCENSEEKEH